jgi:N-terminal half of MaoC dehydratase
MAMDSADAVERPARLPVEAGKVAEFRRATGLPPLPGAPFAPPTFYAALEHHGPTVASIMVDLGFPLDRVLHGEERVSFPAGPLRVGDELTGTVRLVGRDTREASVGTLTRVHFAIDLHRPDGTLAAQVERTLVVIPG